jgi:hypothetical protein
MWLWPHRYQTFSKFNVLLISPRIQFLLVSFPQELLILEFLTTSNIVREIGRTCVGFLRLSTTIALVKHSNCYEHIFEWYIWKITEHVMSGRTSNSEYFVSPQYSRGPHIVKLIYGQKHSSIVDIYNNIIVISWLVQLLKSCVLKLWQKAAITLICLTANTRLVGRDSSVDIVTRYGLGGPGIDCRWRRDFPHPSRLALGPPMAPVQWVPCLFPRGNAVGAWHWPPTTI